ELAPGQNGLAFVDSRDILLNDILCYIPTTHHFGADEDGNFWWHCDHNTQYTYGQRGPLIIHPREDQLQPWEMDVGAEYKCPEDQPLTHFRFQAGKSYHLRLMFMRALDQLEFSIDGHQLRAIAPSGESLEPSKLITNITINIGQQIDLLVQRGSTVYPARRRHINAGEGLSVNGQAMVYGEEDDYCNETSTVGENELTPGTSQRCLQPQTNKRSSRSRFICAATHRAWSEAVMSYWLNCRRMEELQVMKVSSLVRKMTKM
ncbi:Multicopper oxidase, partial [Phytophthora infestans]